MARSRLGAACSQAGATFLRNLPAVLLFSAGYFVFFSALWGPLRPWKLAVAAGVVVGLCLGLDLRDPWRRVARGGRRSRAGAPWPTWRRVGATTAGALLCFAGLYQATGREVDVGNLYPLLSGLCLIVSLAIGVILIVRAQPRVPWRRKGPRPPPRLTPPGPPPAPRRRARVEGSAMEVPVPREQGYLGIWGAVGTRPARPAWKPGGSKSPAGPGETVPPRFGRLRLTRRTRSREAPAPAAARVVVCILAAGLFAILVAWLLFG